MQSVVFHIWELISLSSGLRKNVNAFYIVRFVEDRLNFLPVRSSWDISNPRGPASVSEKLEYLGTLGYLVS